MAAASSPAAFPPAQEEVAAFLERDAFGSGVAVRRIDTHCASVFLAGDRAWKLKRAVRFGYLDFSTPAKRRDALTAELRLNLRTAPGLYRAIHPVTRAAGGRLTIDGEGQAMDWLLEMARFPDDALFDLRAERGQLAPGLLTRLADRIAAFHASAAIAATNDGAARFQTVIGGNVASMKACPDILDPGKVKLLGERLAHLCEALSSLLDERSHAGRVRHGHGDLHLANIALIDGEPTLFDCLEFSTELATIDVLYDLAFLLMDLWHRDLRTGANIVLNRYLDLSAIDEEGLAAMPLFLSVRAAIRAHVVAMQSRAANGDAGLASTARAYLDLALSLRLPVPPRLIAIGGLSGSGKSTLARMLGGYAGRAPGARILRSDVIRKRLAGLAPETRLPGTAYTEQATAIVYAATERMAATALALGQSVIADAVFADPAERANIEAVARNAGVGFDGLWLEAPDAVRLARVAARAADASDADVAVARAQVDLAVGDPGHWRRVDVAGQLDMTVAAIRTLLAL